MPMTCPVHLVLDDLKEVPGNLCPGVIIYTGGINIQHLAPEYLFLGPDIPDAGKQLIKVIATPHLLQAFIIQSKALDYIFP